MTKAAIFDMDGLMYDTERITTEGWLDAAKKMGFSLTREQCDLFRGTNKEFKLHLFYDWYKDTVDYEDAFSLKQQYVENYILQNGVPVKKGLYELLDALQKKGYKIAVATSTSRAKAQIYWEQTKVSGYFDETICGDEVTKSKPDPEIFLKAAAKLDIPIEDCIIFEDSYNGINAGSKAGAVVVMVPDMLAPTEEIRQKCDYILEDLSKAIAIL